MAIGSCISDGLWRRRFGARPDIVSSTTTLDGHTVTIVGVAPASVRFPATAEFWRPLIFTPRDLAPGARGTQWVQVLARLKDTCRPARRPSRCKRWPTAWRRSFRKQKRTRRCRPSRCTSGLLRDIRPILMIVLGSVTLVLLIACANVANLLLARGQARGREAGRAHGSGREPAPADRAAADREPGPRDTRRGGRCRSRVLDCACSGAARPDVDPSTAGAPVDMNVLGVSLALALVTSIVSGLTPALAISGTVDSPGCSIRAIAVRSARAERGARRRSGHLGARRRGDAAGRRPAC